MERKSVGPMAARLAPGNVRQMHQSLHNIVADAAWSADALLKQVRSQVLPAMTRKHALAAWIVDDTGFPKKGIHSVGVARQYCGQLGKQENCRVAVSVSLATEQASIPAAYRLYLPELWANDEQRRKQAGVPQEMGFQTKPKIVLGQIRSLVIEDVPRGVVLADAAYGNDNGFREGWKRWGFPTRLASSPRLRFGLRASRRCHHNRKTKWAVRPGCCEGKTSISRFRPRNLPCV